MEPNFSGYVTRYNIKCSDGRTIMGGAFKHQDGLKVPVVYNHNHTDISQTLGHAILSAKDDGIWGDVYLDPEVPNAKIAGSLVKNKSIDKFSVWAKNLIERGEFVHSGDIQEVSLVLAGANSGAVIYDVLMHSGVDQEDLLIVGGEIVHADTAVEEKPAEVTEETGGDTVVDTLDTLTDEQKIAVNSFIDDFVKEAVTEALTEENLKKIEHSDLSEQKGTTPVSRNAFDENTNSGSSLPQLKHADASSILSTAKGPLGDGKGGVESLRDLVRSAPGKELMHAADYGVENIEILFPDAQALMNTPHFIDRRQDWVKKFMSGTSHSPFSRVKTYYADITADEARARGYIKGDEKVEEVFPIFKRETGPTWVYKMQKLDRQDIIDVTSFDIVAWMKVEMRGKLDEEIARAALVGDGRPTLVGGELNPAKIQDPGAANASGDGIRAILNDNDLYVTRVDVPMVANPVGGDWNILLDTVTEQDEFYMGSGNKTGFMTYRVATKLITIRDDWGKRLYRNLSEVAGDMGLSQIVKVPTDLFPAEVLCIVLDLSDYNFGTNRGGEVTLFDDFDIKFNQYLYLIETYLSGALTLPYSAQVFKSVASTATLLVPTTPAYNTGTHVLTVPTQTGVTWKRTDTGASVSNGATITLNEDTLPVVELEATASTGYYFGDDRDETDSFTYEYATGLVS